MSGATPVSGGRCYEKEQEINAHISSPMPPPQIFLRRVDNFGTGSHLVNSEKYLGVDQLKSQRERGRSNDIV
jgi:hypothetical protein